MPDQIDTVIEADEPLGVETDAAVKIEFARYFRFALEAGLLFPMDGLGTVGTGLPWTLQSRLAMVF